MSPGCRAEPSSTTVAVDSGPMTRCVSVFLAARKCGAGRVCRRSVPGVSVSDHLAATGAWFHCQTGRSFEPEKSSLRW